MKLFFNLFGVATAGVLGYLAEPSLRLILTGTEPSAVEQGKYASVRLQMPDGAPQIDLATLTPEQLPQQILVLTDVTVSDPATGMEMIVKSGNRVKLVRIEGGNAVVSPGEGVFRGLVPVNKTDLFKQLAVSLPAAHAVPTPPPVAVVPAPVTPPKADLPEPATPEPPPVPEPAPVEAGTTDVVKAMQDSVKAAQIKEFTFEQVLEWKAEADEASDAVGYSLGRAADRGGISRAGEQRLALADDGIVDMVGRHGAKCRDAQRRGCRCQRRRAVETEFDAQPPRLGGERLRHPGRAGGVALRYFRRLAEMPRQHATERIGFVGRRDQLRGADGVDLETPRERAAIKAPRREGLAAGVGGGRKRQHQQEKSCHPREGGDAPANDPARKGRDTPTNDPGPPPLILSWSKGERPQASQPVHTRFDKLSVSAWVWS